MSDAIEDGGPAFPVSLYDGMSLRDYFAGQWLAGLGTDPETEDSTPKEIAEGCYNVADAMLEARKE